jgi:hypothetical protein
MAVGFNIQIGPAGALIVLPSPSFGYEIPLTRPRTVRTLLGGGVRVQQAPQSSRRWAYEWNRPLSAQDYQLIRDIYLADIGALPYELHDPTVATVPLVVPVDDLDAASSWVGAVAAVKLTLQEVVA